MPTYFLLIVALCLVAQGELQELDAKVPNLSWALPAVALMLWGSWVTLFGGIRAADIKRVAVAKEEIAQGAMSIEVAKLPHSELLQNPNPEAERWVRRFKQFYGLDEDDELVFK